jgi:ribosome-binding factor A
MISLAFQILTVRVDDDFKKLNIFWVAQDMREDGKIERVLKSIAGPLRHELSILRLMGEVPQINFVKDRSHMKSAEIDAVLKYADFGEDFVPTDKTLFLKSEPVLEMKISEGIKEKLKEFESEAVQNEDEEEEEEMPPMRHDTFGLDHAKIMSKIVASLNKSKKAWESFEQENSSSSIIPPSEIKNSPESVLDEVNKLKNEAEMRESFIKFLEIKQWRRRITPERKKSKKVTDDDDHDDSSPIYSDPVPDGDYLEEDDVKR